MKLLVLRARSTARKTSFFCSSSLISRYKKVMRSLRETAVAGRYIGNNATNWPVALFDISSISAHPRRSISFAPFWNVIGSKQSFSIVQTRLRLPSTKPYRSIIFLLPKALYRQFATVCGTTSTNERKRRDPTSVFITSASEKGLPTRRISFNRATALPFLDISLNWAPKAGANEAETSEVRISSSTLRSLSFEQSVSHSHIKYQAIGRGRIKTNLPLRSSNFLPR